MNKFEYNDQPFHFLTIKISPDRVFCLFQHSFYEVYLIDAKNPLPYVRLSVQRPITHFSIINVNTRPCVVVSCSTGQWVIYEIGFEGSGPKLKQLSKSRCINIEKKVIGVHLIENSQEMILFVYQDGVLQYNYIGGEKSKIGTLKYNKIYEIEYKSDKRRKSSLFNKYKGKELLESCGEMKIRHSLYNTTTNELFTVVQDQNSKIWEIQRYFLQDYQVIAGSDFLLNISKKPLDFLLYDQFILVNIGDSIICWSKNRTQTVQLPTQGFCTSMLTLGKNRFQLCIVQKSETTVYTVQSSISKSFPSFQMSKIFALKSNDPVIHWVSNQQNKSFPGISINSKLQVLSWEKENQPKLLITNMQISINNAKFHQKELCSFLVVEKVIGLLKQRKLVTNNRLIVDFQEYNHNMILKMSKIEYFKRSNQGVDLFLSSPILGTLKLSLLFPSEKKNNKLSNSSSNQAFFVIGMGNSESNIIGQQQSIFIDPPGYQLTNSKIIFNKVRLNVADLFENTTESILSGCIIGNYALLAVERQVHLFSMQGKPKRLNIYCSSKEIRFVHRLNSLNLILIVLWSGEGIVLKIKQKQLAQVSQIQNVGCDINQNYFNFEAIINTVPYIVSIIGTKIIIVSNDPLHAYQSQRTTINIFDFPIALKGRLHPMVDYHDKGEKFTMLSSDDQKWISISLSKKYLVKDFSEIKMEIEQIIGLPKIQNTIFALLKDPHIFVLSGNKLLTGSLRTGSITISSQTISRNQNVISTSINYDYLQNWVRNYSRELQTLSMQNLSDPNLIETHRKILKISQSNLIMYNSKEIWYCYCSNQGKVKPISYFSMPNDAFLQFRNNLSIYQLQNTQFMSIFAEKLPIKDVAGINENTIALLYPKIIVVVEINLNGGLSIKQEIHIKDFEGIHEIDCFIGRLDSSSIYLRDTSNRLILLRSSQLQKKYKLEVIYDLEDEVVRIESVKYWKQRSRKIKLSGKDEQFEEQMIIKKQGHIIVGKEMKPIYI